MIRLTLMPDGQHHGVFSNQTTVREMTAVAKCDGPFPEFRVHRIRRRRESPPGMWLPSELRRRRKKPRKDHSEQGSEKRGGRPAGFLAPRSGMIFRRLQIVLHADLDGSDRTERHDRMAPRLFCRD